MAASSSLWSHELCRRVQGTCGGPSSSSPSSVLSHRCFVMLQLLLLSGVASCGISSAALGIPGELVG